MEIMELLFYKNDEFTNQKRISKTKSFTIIFFILFFIWGLITFANTNNANMNVLSIFISSVIFSLFFTVPIFVIGFLLGKILNSSDSNQNVIHQNQVNNYQQQRESVQYNNEFLNNQKMNDRLCSQNFKDSIKNNKADDALDQLNKWNNQNDANYVYARIIYDGMPPSDYTFNELNSWFENANRLESSDKTLGAWYKSTALEVLNMNKDK